MQLFLFNLDGTKDGTDYMALIQDHRSTAITNRYPILAGKLVRILGWPVRLMKPYQGGDSGTRV